MTEDQLFARIKKSDFAGLPETDHRIIGERLDLFSFQEPSPGMVYWHDKGLKLRNLLIEFMRGELAKGGYIEISTPALVSNALWKVSGHWDHYKQNLFLTDLGGEEFGLKPMNCPPTMLYYRTRRWSFRELPLRVSCFDHLYRNELSGVASGLFRVKAFSQDDAHIFVTEEQVESEVKGMIDLLDRVFKTFGLEYKLNLSTMPDDHIGDEGVLGEGGGDPRPSHGGEGHPVQAQGEGRGVLRPQDRRGHQGLDGQGVAELDHPARLSAPPEVQAYLRGLGREGPHAGRDTPRHLRAPSRGSSGYTSSTSRGSSPSGSRRSR